MAGGKIVQVETRKRGLFGKLVKYAFILFNVLMIAWLASYAGQIGDTMNGAQSEAYKAGAAIGGGIGTMMLFVIWVFGDIILGIAVALSRGKRILTTVTE